MIVIFCGLFILSSSLQVSTEDARESVQDVDLAADALFEEYWQNFLKDNPETATYNGDHRYDDKLNCDSLKCDEERKIKTSKFLERASQLLTRAQKGSKTYNNLELFIYVLEFLMDRLTDGGNLLAVSYLTPPKMSILSLLSYIKFENAKNYWDLIARYRAFPQQIDYTIELLREGIRKNFTLNEHSLWKPKNEPSNVIESPFYEPFINISSNVSAEEANFIRSNATDAIINGINRSLKKLDDFLRDEYLPNSRKEIGLGSLPGGQEYYRKKLISRLSDPSVTAAAIHAKGLEEVERIGREMTELIQSLGFNLTRKEFDDKLRKNDSNYFSTEEEALDTFRDVLFNVIARKLPLIFEKIPQTPLRVEKVPELFAGGPLAYYMMASGDKSTPATFYVDTSSLKSLPRHEVMALSLHEGNPGHHFQASYVTERRDIPEFIKYNLYSTAYMEGWGLYAEYLGNELGLYKDPYTKYGHLSYEMFRACRMVVDTGIHAFGWNRQKAIDYMMDHIFSPLKTVEREIKRYITWPAQACAYKYGELKIKELRKKAKSQLGDKFDIKHFHDVVLRNNGPLDLVEKHVDLYIQSTKNA